MKNFSKILCVVLALVIALSAASCSLSKQYAYEKDDIKLPIGVYIYYLYNAYNSAQSYAQKSDLYDSATGKYDGKKSFLKMEITDDDGKTAVAEDWIKDKAAEDTKTAVAIQTKFNDLGCTLDQTEIDSTQSYYKSYWDQSYSEMLEPYGISFDSFFLAGYTLPAMESEAFKAEYGTGGPSAVSDEELTKYFKDNYTSYKYFSANLYTTETAENTDGSAETASENIPLSADKIAEYQKDFDGYATTLSDGGSYADVVAEYMKKYAVEEDPTTENVEDIDEESTDEIMKTILDMKDGQAMTVVIGDDDTTKQIYLVYREPIENQVEAYTDPEQHKNDVLSAMKHEEFDEMLKKLAEEMNITLSSACDSYKPSRFEETKKK
ncbi:MAG: hypothetical protein II698_05265 [Ruminococcus sp.]|nr:hypothetical protein [Ruminococcus sp.]MBQ4238698.1 hypothetical protein [Ruminococcus sp.]